MRHIVIPWEVFGFTPNSVEASNHRWGLGGGVLEQGFDNQNSGNWTNQTKRRRMIKSIIENMEGTYNTYNGAYNESSMNEND